MIKSTVKSIMLISIFSLFIISTAHVPTAKAGWLKDAVKDKLRKEARKKLRKEEDRAHRRERERGGHHRRGDRHRRRGDSHKRNRRYDGYNYAANALQTIRRVERVCPTRSSWKKEALCFLHSSRSIRSDINHTLDNRYYSSRVENTLKEMNRDLSKAIRKCDDKRTWKKSANCFKRRLGNIYIGY